MAMGFGGKPRAVPSRHIIKDRKLWREEISKSILIPMIIFKIKFKIELIKYVEKSNAHTVMRSVCLSGFRDLVLKSTLGNA
jgi:hypothetical protein